MVSLSVYYNLPQHPNLVITAPFMKARNPVTVAAGEARGDVGKHSRWLQLYREKLENQEHEGLAADC